AADVQAGLDLLVAGPTNAEAGLGERGTGAGGAAEEVGELAGLGERGCRYIWHGRWRLRGWRRHRQPVPLGQFLEEARRQDPLRHAAAGVLIESIGVPPDDRLPQRLEPRVLRRLVDPLEQLPHLLVKRFAHGQATLVTVME